LVAPSANDIRKYPPFPPKDMPEDILPSIYGAIWLQRTIRAGGCTSSHGQYTFAFRNCATGR